MSGVVRGLKKVFRPVARVLKKIALPVLMVAATVLTGGAALGAVPAVTGVGAKLGLSAGLSKVLGSALTYAATGAVGGALAGGGRGAARGALMGGLMGAATAALPAIAPKLTKAVAAVPGAPATGSSVATGATSVGQSAAQLGSSAGSGGGLLAGNAAVAAPVANVADLAAGKLASMSAVPGATGVAANVPVAAASGGLFGGSGITRDLLLASILRGIGESVGPTDAELALKAIAKNYRHRGDGLGILDFDDLAYLRRWSSLRGDVPYDAFARRGQYVWDPKLRRTVFVDDEGM